MKNRSIKFAVGIFLLLLTAGALQIVSQTPDENLPPLESYQQKQEKICKAQKIPGERTYAFRELPLPTGETGAYGPKRWYSFLEPVFPFLKSSNDNYRVDDIRNLKRVYGKAAPLGEAKRSKQIRSNTEQKLLEEQQEGERKWQEWLMQNPQATDEEKNTAEIRLRMQGLALAKLEKFDWREQGLDVGAVGFQGWNCNTCWAFASIDAMQTSRKLAALRAGKSDFNETLLPSVRQLASCRQKQQIEFDCKKTGWHGDIFSYFVDEGMPLGGSKKYGDGKFTMECDSKESVRALTWDYVVPDATEIAPTDEIKRAIIVYGPVVAVIKLDDCLALYGGDVFNEEQKTGGRHFVLIVGWDDARRVAGKKIGAWLVKNSWGEEWGEGGFGWIKYGTNRIGEAAAWIAPDPKEEGRINSFKSQVSGLN